MLRFRSWIIGVSALLSAGFGAMQPCIAAETLVFEAGSSLQRSNGLFVGAGWGPTRYLTVELSSFNLDLEGTRTERSAPALGLALRAMLPVSPDMGLFARAGGALWSVEERFANFQTLKENGSSTWLEGGVYWRFEGPLSAFASVRTVDDVPTFEERYNGEGRFGERKQHSDFLAGLRIGF